MDRLMNAVLRVCLKGYRSSVPGPCEIAVSTSLQASEVYADQQCPVVTVTSNLY